MWNKLLQRKITADLSTEKSLEHISTNELLVYLRNFRSCTIYVGLDRRMYELDMNKFFTDQEWSDFKIFSERYNNGKMFERAEDVLTVWERLSH